MSKIQVPGTDRWIEFDLHEPDDTKPSLFVAAGTRMELTPREFAKAVSSPVTDGGFAVVETVLQVVKQKSVPDHVSFGMLRSARAYEFSRRKLIGGRTGRPRCVDHFSQAEDIAIVVLYFESIGHKQAIRETLEYWKAATGVCPTRRRIDETLHLVRKWKIPQLSLAADEARRRHILPKLPQKRLAKVRKRT